jgi:LPS-assembly lipoprotein
MSWSDARLRSVWLLLALVALAGCDLKPIYRSEERGVVLPDLAAIDVTQLYGRRGQYLRGYLLDEFNPQGLTIPPEYQLDILLRQESNTLAIQLDNTPTRANLALGAVFTLKRLSDGAVLYDSAVRRVVSYNIRADPFATLITEQDAERRAAREIARQIRTILSLYFANQPT